MLAKKLRSSIVVCRIAFRERSGQTKEFMSQLSISKRLPVLYFAHLSRAKADIAGTNADTDELAVDGAIGLNQSSCRLRREAWPCGPDC